MKTEIPDISTDPYKRDVQPNETPIVETAVQARQGFLGRPVLVVLIVSMALAIGIGGIMLVKNWVVF